MIAKLKLVSALICRESEAAQAVARKLRSKKARSIFVVNGKSQPVGIISCTDFTYKVAAEHKDISKLKAGDIMNSPLECCDINDEPEKAMAIMIRRRNYGCLVTKNRKAKGVLDYKTATEAIIKALKAGQHGA